MDVVSFGQAEKLYTLGYRQEHFLQLMYNSAGHLDLWTIAYMHERAYLRQAGYIPAPSYLEALDWLEERKGRLWKRSTPDEMVLSGTYHV